MYYSGRMIASAAAVGLTLTAGVLAAEKGQADPRPNILVVLADDLGFSDLGCFGGEIHTPNMNSLANEGLRFREFYNCARCSPSRASLLTGLYAHKANLARNGRSLSRNAVTIAEVLRGAGYQTGMVGKWHLSEDRQLPKPEQLKWLNHQLTTNMPFAPLETYPVNRGFDRFYGVIWGVIDYFDPFSLVEGTNAVPTVPDDFYFTDAVSDQAIKDIRDFSKKPEPFFLYVAECASHWPLHALPEDIQKYKGRYDQGWDVLRKERFARQQELGLFAPGQVKLPPIETGIQWNKLEESRRAFLSAKMEAHAAIVDRLDQQLGRIIEALKETGQYENTVIFFLSDNGASPEVPIWPAGYDRPSETRDGRKMLRDKDLQNHIELVGSEESYTGIGPSWASALNTPYRFWKKESYEGGNHTPLIVHWPAGLKQKGAFSDQVGHIMDIMPTCIELANATYPTRYEGNAIRPLDGISLLPVLKGETRAGHNRLFFEHEKGRAVREGDWKAVANCKTPDQWKLYNLAKDPSETVDLSAEYPEKKDSMIKAWTEWFKTMPE